MARVTPAAKRKAPTPTTSAPAAATPASAVDASPPALTVAPDQPAPIAVLRVVGPALGRRRAGRAFGAEATVIPLTDLSDADVAAIEGDPLLTVVLDAIDPADLVA